MKNILIILCLIPFIVNGQHRMPHTAKELILKRTIDEIISERENKNIHYNVLIDYSENFWMRHSGVIGWNTVILPETYIDTALYLKIKKISDSNILSFSTMDPELYSEHILVEFYYTLLNIKNLYNKYNY